MGLARLLLALFLLSCPLAYAGPSGDAAAGLAESPEAPEPPARGRSSRFVPIPDYDLILEGKFTAPSGYNMDYIFKPKNGGEIRVWPSSMDCLPEGYWPNFEDEVRLYILRSDRHGGPLRGSIHKLEIIRRVAAADAQYKVSVDMVRRITGDGSITFLRECMERLNPDELREVKWIIEDDLRTGKHLVVGTTPTDYYLALRVINEIDERLGTLDYDLVLEGRLGGSYLGGHVYWYFFISNQGEHFELAEGMYTLWPEHDRIREGDEVRVFVKLIRGEGIMRGLLMKMDLIKSNPNPPPPYDGPAY